MDSTKNPNLETTHNHTISSSSSSSSSSSQSLKRTHDDFCIKKAENPCDDHVVIGESSPTAAARRPEKVVVVVEESGREKLKRHRVEMSGRVWIPDIWGQEDLLKKWIDCTVFDSCVEKSSIMSARDALIQEGRSTLSIENSC